MRDQLVSDRGDVFTGSGSSSEGLVVLVELPGLFKVEGNHRAGDPDSVRITNTSGSPLEYSWSGGGGTVSADASVDVSLTCGERTTLVQLLRPADEVVSTVTIDTVPKQAGVDFVVQALAEPPRPHDPAA